MLNEGIRTCAMCGLPIGGSPAAQFDGEVWFCEESCRVRWMIRHGKQIEQ